MLLCLLGDFSVQPALALGLLAEYLRIIRIVYFNTYACMCVLIRWTDSDSLQVTSMTSYYPSGNAKKQKTQM